MTAFIILHDFRGNVSAEQRDPYQWIDPFSEIEDWATRCGEMRLRQDEEVARIRERYEAEVAHWRRSFEGLVETVTRAMPVTMPPIIIAKDPA